MVQALSTSCHRYERANLFNQMSSPYFLRPSNPGPWSGNWGFTGQGSEAKSRAEGRESNIANNALERKRDLTSMSEDGYNGDAHLRKRVKVKIEDDSDLTGHHRHNSAYLPDSISARTFSIILSRFRWNEKTIGAEVSMKSQSN